MLFFKKIFNFNFIRVFSTKYQRNEATTLYKHLLKQCKKLPKGPKEHYQFMIKQSFKQHVKESDPERIKQIIKRSYEDCDWILKKLLKGFSKMNKNLRKFSHFSKCIDTNHGA